MIRGFHFIFSAYGFWLPNDPRGSWSNTVRRYELLAFGPATKTDTRRSVAGAAHDAEQRLAAKRVLRRTPVRFTGRQAREVARGFETACGDAGYGCHALAVLPDHAHVVISRHHKPTNRIAAHLKAKATAALSMAGLHPFADGDRSARPPSPWARGFWCVYLNSDRHVQQAIRYVESNPVKAGLPRQRWRFVVPWNPYDNTRPI
mgnify:CR=1 FL=1